MDSQWAAGLGEGAAGGDGAGLGVGVSLEPAGPGEPAGLGPAPPPESASSVVCRACLPLSCARFASPKSVASWLPPHHPPSSALRLRVGEGSWRLPPIAGPCGPRAQCSFSLSPSERTRVGQRETRATGTRALGPGSVRPAALVLPRGTGSWPHTPARPRKPWEASAHFLLGPLVSLQRPRGASPAPRCLSTSSPPLVASLWSFQKF